MGRKSVQPPAHVYDKDELIFVKIKGYPHWPAKIESTPSDVQAKSRYNVRFFGTNEVYVARDDMILPYNEQTVEKYGQKKRLLSFNCALDEIANEPRAKRARIESNKKSEPESIAVEVENVMNSIIKKIVKENIINNEEEFEGLLPDGSGLLISHNEGKRSYETFCKYLSQFKVIKSEQIQMVKSVYQQLTSQIVPQIDLEQSDAKLKEE